MIHFFRFGHSFKVNEIWDNHEVDVTSVLKKQALKFYDKSSFSESKIQQNKADERRCGNKNGANKLKKRTEGQNE